MKIKPTIKQHPSMSHGYSHGHRLRSRTRCLYCKRSFNIAKASAQGNHYTPEHEDYWGEACEASATCRRCIIDQDGYYSKLGLALEAKMFMEGFENTR